MTIADENAAQAALKAGDFTTFGKLEDKIKTDVATLQQLIAQQAAGASPTPSATASPTP